MLRGPDQMLDSTHERGTTACYNTPVLDVSDDIDLSFSIFLPFLSESRVDHDDAENCRALRVCLKLRHVLKGAAQETIANDSAGDIRAALFEPAKRARGSIPHADVD